MVGEIELGAKNKCELQTVRESDGGGGVFDLPGILDII